MIEEAVRIEYLADRPEAIPVIARWLHDEFRDFIPGKPVEYVIEMLHGRLNHDAIPLGILAIADGEIIGTVSLKDHDMDIRNDLTPWLASLYVNGKYRNRGVGRYLVQTIQDIARKFGVRELYLYTPEAECFYGRIGWIRLEQVTYHSKDVVIMKIKL